MVAAIFGWSAGTTAKMAKRYGHMGTDAQRLAVASLDGSETSRATSEAKSDESTPGEVSS